MPGKRSIMVGNQRIAKNDRAVSLTKSDKLWADDAIEWRAAGTRPYKIKFEGTNDGSGTNSESPFTYSEFTATQNGTNPVPSLKNGVVLDHAYKYSVYDDSNKIDDPYVIIEA